MERRELLTSPGIAGAGVPVKPQNAMHFLHDNCASIAALSERLRIVADHIAGARPMDPSNRQEKGMTILSRLEDQAFMLNECFEELDRIERGLGVEGEGAGIQAGR